MFMERVIFKRKASKCSQQVNRGSL